MSTGLSWFGLFCSPQGCILLSFSVKFWTVLAYSVLVCPGHHSGMSWSVMAYSDLNGSVLEYSALSWSVQAYQSLTRPFLVYPSLFRSVLLS